MPATQEYKNQTFTITSTIQYRGPQFPDDVPESLRETLREMAKGKGEPWVYRFATECGRVAWVPVSKELVEDAAIDAEGEIRRMAGLALAELPGGSDASH
jgi:hypothetical protein